MNSSQMSFCLFTTSGSTGHSKVSSVKNMLDVEGRPQEGPSCTVAHGSLEGLLVFLCGLWVFLGIISGSSEAVSLENLVQPPQKLLSQATPVVFFSLPGFVSYSFLFFLRRTLMEKNTDQKTNPGPFS